jgi:hypothetical protein
LRSYPSPKDLLLNLAWEFTEVIPGDFVRDRPLLRDKPFPIIGPQPTGADTKPIDNAGAQGPFIYFLFNSLGEIMYVGKADERTVLYRWIRPDARNGTYQWSHGTNSPTKKSTIEFISDELRAGRGPVRLHFSNITSLRGSVIKRAEMLGISLAELNTLSDKQFTNELEHFLIYSLQPELNIQRKKTPPVGLVSKCGDYWLRVNTRML